MIFNFWLGLLFSWDSPLFESLIHPMLYWWFYKVLFYLFLPGAPVARLLSSFFGLDLTTVMRQCTLRLHVYAWYRLGHSIFPGIHFFPTYEPREIKASLILPWRAEKELGFSCSPFRRGSTSWLQPCAGICARSPPHMVQAASSLFEPLNIRDLLSPRATKVKALNLTTLTRFPLFLFTVGYLSSFSSAIY